MRTKEIRPRGSEAPYPSRHARPPYLGTWISGPGGSTCRKNLQHARPMPALTDADTPDRILSPQRQAPRPASSISDTTPERQEQANTDLWGTEMTKSIDRAWLTLEAAARRMSVDGLKVEPGDVLHLAGKGHLRAYTRLRDRISVTATMIEVLDGVPSVVEVGKRTMIAFVRLKRQAAYLLESREVVQVQEIVQGRDDPLEGFDRMEPEYRWEPDEPLIAVWADIAVVTSDVDKTAASIPAGEGTRPSTVAAESAAWPWGMHETELLGHLRAAGKHWWSNYDPDDPSTAPTNERVIKWLKHRNVSARTAESMATILRADGLRSGRR